MEHGVSVTYFPLVALLLCRSSPLHGGVFVGEGGEGCQGRAELLTPSLLSRCVRSPCSLGNTLWCVGGGCGRLTQWMSMSCTVGVAGTCWAVLGLDPCSALGSVGLNLHYCSYSMIPSTSCTCVNTGSVLGTYQAAPSSLSGSNILRTVDA